MKAALESIAFLFAWALAFGAAYMVIPWQSLPFSNVTTIYTRTCVERAKIGTGCAYGAWRADDPKKFLVIPDTQTVAVQFGESAPMRLSDCAVIDRKNWECNVTKYSTIAIIDGEFKDSTSSLASGKIESAPDHEEISRARWMYLRFRAWGK